MKWVDVALLFLRLGGGSLIVNEFSAYNDLVTKGNLPVSLLIFPVSEIECTVDIESFTITFSIVRDIEGGIAIFGSELVFNTRNDTLNIEVCLSNNVRC